MHKSYARADFDDLDVDDIAKVDSYHGPPKPTFLEVFMVNHLVFRWPKGPKPVFFNGIGGLMVVRSRWLLAIPFEGTRIDGICG